VCILIAEVLYLAILRVERVLECLLILKGLISGFLERFLLLSRLPKLVSDAIEFVHDALLVGLRGLYTRCGLF